MKIIISLLCTCMVMLGCIKEEANQQENPIYENHPILGQEITQNDCVTISQNSNWATEDFKKNYTIQFPNTYEGTGKVGFEGNIFNKNRVDGKVELTYSFCSPVFCDDFGDTLDVPIPNSVNAKDKENNDITLNSKKEFCLNTNKIGVLYYNIEMNSTGKYYIKQGSEYREGLTIYFTNTEYQEVENIIKTITEN